MPETQTQPEFEEPNKKFTATAMEDNSCCVDVVMQPIQISDIEDKMLWVPVVYVRPQDKSFLDAVSGESYIGICYLNGSQEVTYEFRNFNSKEIKKKLMGESTSRYGSHSCVDQSFGQQIFRVTSSKHSHDLVALAREIHEELGHL